MTDTFNDGERRALSALGFSTSGTAGFVRGVMTARLVYHGPLSFSADGDAAGRRAGLRLRAAVEDRQARGGSGEINMTEAIESWPVHPAAELLPMMSDVEIDELAIDIADHGLLEPVVFWADNTAQKESGQYWGLDHCPRYLLDGRSRLKAIERLGRNLEDMRCLTKTPQHPKIIIPAWRRKPQVVMGAWPWHYFDPWAYVLSANVRRRHLTSAQKREVVGKLLQRRPELSDRALAQLARVSDKTVAAARAEAEECAEIPHIPPTMRIAADGKTSRARLPAADAVSEIAPPQAWSPGKRCRFLSPVKWNAPRNAKIVAARAYLDYLDLTIDDLLEAVDAIAGRPHGEQECTNGSSSSRTDPARADRRDACGS